VTTEVTTVLVYDAAGMSDEVSATANCTALAAAATVATLDGCTLRLTKDRYDKFLPNPTSPNPTSPEPTTPSRLYRSFRANAGFSSLPVSRTSVSQLPVASANRIRVDRSATGTEVTP
jgi:hypothetical protein